LARILAIVAMALGAMVFLGVGLLDFVVYELYTVFQSISVKRTPFDPSLTVISALGLLVFVIGLVALLRQARRP
jgi:hypothetical protein